MKRIVGSVWRLQPIQPQKTLKTLTCNCVLQKGLIAHLEDGNLNAAT